jgi:hypothetical protein
LKDFADYQSIENQFARYAVATYLYIPEKYNQLKVRAREVVNSLYGSHVGLMPTILELSLTNASYYKFANYLMKKNNSYGWITQDALIDGQSIVDSKTKKLYPWDEQNKVKLTRQILNASERELKIIQQEQYKRLYKKWLLYKDKVATLSLK